MPRCIVRITPNYRFNSDVNPNANSTHQQANSQTPVTTDNQWEYNTSASAKYFYESTDPTSLTIYPSNVRYNGKTFHFDKIYDSILSQYDFYRMEIQDYIGYLVNGQSEANQVHATKASASQQRDVCVLLLGDHASGEKFIKYGPPEHPGLLYRSLKDVFSLVEQKNDVELMQGSSNQHPVTRFVSVSCYYVEQNSDNLLDVFEAYSSQTHNSKRKRQLIRLRDHPKRGMVVEGVTRIPIDSPESGMNLLVQAYAQQSAQLQNAHVAVSINVETQTQASRNGGGSAKKSSCTSLTFLSLNSPHDQKGNILPRSKQPAWIRNLKACLEGLENRSPSIPFHKSKPTTLLRDLLLGNRAGLVIHALSPNIESYKQMLWNMNLCQKLVDVSPKTKPQLASPIQYNQMADVSDFLEEHQRQEAPSPMPQTSLRGSIMNQAASHNQSQSSFGGVDADSSIYTSHQSEQDSQASFNDTNSFQNSRGATNSSRKKGMRRSASHHQLGSVPQSFLLRAQGSSTSLLSTGSTQSASRKTPQRRHPLKRSQSKISVSTSGFSQNTFHQDPSLVSSPSSPVGSTMSSNNFLTSQEAELLSKYKKESVSLKSELEILKRLKQTHQRKISQLEEKLDEFRNQHQEALRSMKKHSKKGSEKNGSFSQKDFDMYREVMEQAITRMKETQSKLEQQNDALKRHINKKDQDLRKKDKELIKLKRSQNGEQSVLEQVEQEKKQLEKRLKLAEKRIASLEKSKKSSSIKEKDTSNNTSVPEGYTIVRKDKVQKYEEYIKETVDFNDKLRREVLKQADTIERYRQRYGNLSAGGTVSNLGSRQEYQGDQSEDGSTTEENLKHQLNVVKEALADALKQLAVAKQ